MSFDETPASTEIFQDDLLSGKTALITGGGTGIGRHLALAFADHGADVAIVSRNMDHLAPVEKELRNRGVDAYATTVDVREHESVVEMTEEVVDHLGPLTTLVNNAGANFLCKSEELSQNGWRAVLGTILDGTAYCSFEVGEHMIDNGGGSIISMGATNSVLGAPYRAHSGAGKAGVDNLMKTLASEWATHNVRANTVAPGPIETAAQAEFMDEETRQQLLNTMVAGRIGTPADCVPPVLFLASDASSFVTGDYIPVDGGQLIASPLASP